MKCRLCKTEGTEPLFSLGEQYVSDFVTKDRVCAGFKVEIALELCRACGLVQQKHTAPQDFLYTRHYWYRSGVTATMREALRNVVYSAFGCVRLRDGDTVLDIGANDGTLLSFYDDELFRVGCEPAKNLFYSMMSHCDAGINDFWSAEKYNFQKAKIVTAIGMFYDMEDPNPFVADVKKVLHLEGVFVAQLMCLQNTLNLKDVGNFAHEHLEFYSLKSLKYLFQKHGLEIFRIEQNSVNGQSYRLYVQHDDGPREVESSVHTWTMVERRLERKETYDDFFKELKYNKFKTQEACKGKRIHVYGASTKGNVLLQYYGLQAEAAADRSPEKHGLYTVGTGIPIVSEEQSRAMRPDYYLVLPYAFLDEFIRREHEFLARGGKFLVPLPEFRVYP